MKTFFNIETSYKFEWNDFRAVVQILNVILILRFGLSLAWLGLIVAVFGLVKDFTTDRHLNSILMHCASVILYITLLTFKG